jgi:hypothetical protein
MESQSQSYLRSKHRSADHGQRNYNSSFVAFLNVSNGNQNAEKLIHYYCRTAPMIHGSSIELFSLHAHLHLPEQVRRHGGLNHSSAFAFESCIRYIERKAHGSKQLAAQIAYWVELESMTNDEKVKICEENVVNVS